MSNQITKNHLYMILLTNIKEKMEKTNFQSIFKIELRTFDFHFEKSSQFSQKSKKSN